MIGVLANVQLEIFQLLVKKNSLLVTITNTEEVPPLHEAVKIRRLDIVKLLLANGANVNNFDLDFENALHLAASNGDYDTIEYLLNETEVDRRARNRDDMNPLCLLLARSRHDDQDLVSRCFHLLLEQTYDKDPLTNTYAISDIFQCAFLACVYSQTEVVKFLVHNVYSVNNSKYSFVRKIAELSNGEHIDFLYYVLVFMHDDIDRYDKYNFPRFFEINYYMCIRSVVMIIDLLLSVEDAVELIVVTLESMQSIGFNIRVKEFGDQFGNLLFVKYSYSIVEEDELRKIEQLLQYLRLKGFKLNLVVKSFLHSIAIAGKSETINIASIHSVLSVLINSATTFFDDLENWKQIWDFKNMTNRIRQIVEWLLTCGNSKINAAVGEVNYIFPLKHLCRVQIRQQLQYDPAILFNHDKLMELGLPEILLNYVLFKN